MRFRRLMAASMAGVMAVSTAIVCQISASAVAAAGETTQQQIFPVSGEYMTIGDNIFSDEANAAIASATTSIKIEIDGKQTEGTDWCQYYLQQNGGADNKHWASATTEYSVNAQTLSVSSLDADFLSAGNFKINGNNIDLKKITVTVDSGTPIVAWQIPTEMVFDSNGNVINIEAADLAAYGVTEDNIADCTVSVTYKSAPTAGVYGAFVKGDWAANFAYADNVASATTEISFANIGANAAKALTDGLMIQFKSSTVTKVVLNVPPAKVAVERVTLDQTTATVQKGKTVTLKATVEPENASDPTVTWESSDEEIATVADGVVTGVAAGTATITAKAGEKTATCKVTVTPTDAETIAAAKTAAETAITNFAATNQTTLADIENAVKQAIKDAKITAEIIVTANCDIVTASEAAPGSIKGTVTLKLNDATATVDNVNLTIKQLPADNAARVADAKEATEKVLKGITATNDTKEADVLAKIKAAIADTKAEATITDFKVTPATSAEAGSVTGTVTLTSGNESATVAINLPIEKLPEEKPVDPVEPEKPAAPEALWEGSTELVSDWSKSIEITGKDFTDFGAGTVVVELEPGEGAQIALKYGADGWPEVPGCKKWYDVTGTKFEIEVTAEAMKTVGKNSLIVGGKNATVKKVTFVPAKADTPAADETVEIDTTSTPVTKIESVDTKTDASGNVTEQIAYCAISEADAKKYDSYIVTITRGKDTKKFTQEIKDCFKAVQYDNKDGETVQVNAKDGSYCILLDITGIGSDFGGITVSIAPNA